QDYARCAAWAAEAGGDAIEVHLAVPDPFAEQPQLIYENIPLAAQILYRVRTTMPKPVLAKVGVFRTPRILHETATKLASWASGFVMTHGVRRRVVDEEGNAAFEGAGRDRATIVGADTWPLASRQIEEMLSWRKAGAWDRAILAVGGITTVERADHLLREGADAALIATTAPAFRHDSISSICREASGHVSAPTMVARSRPAPSNAALPSSSTTRRRTPCVMT